MPFGNQELTDTGVSYLTQAQLGDELRIRRMVVGSGVAATIPDDLWPLTALIAYEIDVPITSSEYVTPDTLKVVGLLDSTKIPTGGGFDLNEIGLMVECGTLPESLYSVDNTGGNGDQIPDMDSTSPVIQQIEIYIKIARVTNITINVVPAGTYDAVNRGLATVGPGPYIEKVGDVLHFKRFVEGKGIELIEDALIPPETITIGIKTLEIDLDLYVPETHPGGTPTTSFPTIQEALDSLDQTIIPPDKTARIHVQGGSYSIAAPIRVYHPQSNRIQIIGEAETTRTVTGGGTVGGASGSYSVDIILDSAANILVDDLVLGFEIAGDWPSNFLVNGISKVIAVTGNTITLQIPPNVVNLASFVLMGGRVIPLKTYIIPAVDVNALEIGGSGLLLLQNFGFVGEGTSVQNAINVLPNGFVYLNTIGVISFNGYGILSQRNTTVFGTDIGIARCGNYGICCNAGSVSFTNLIANYCLGGFWVSLADGEIIGGIFLYNSVGVSVGPAAFLSLTGSIGVHYNGSQGMNVVDQSEVVITGVGSTLDFRVGNTLDLYLFCLSAVSPSAQSFLYYVTSNISPPGFSSVSGCYLPASN